MIELDLAAQRLTERLRKSLSSLRRERAADAVDRLLPELAAPLPSTRMVQFAPNSDNITLPTGTTLESIDDGPALAWRTAAEVHLHPFNVTSASVGHSVADWPTLPQGVRNILRLTLSAPDAVTVPQRMTLHLNGREADTFAWFQALSRDVLATFARGPDGEVVPIRCGAKQATGGLFLTPDGLPAESRLLNELFFCPANLLWMQLDDLPAVSGSVEILFAIRTIPPRVSGDLFRTRCAAVVNEVCRELPMIEIDATRDEWELRPPEGEEVYSLERVDGYNRDTGRWRECGGWQLVRRRNRAMLVFRSPMFGPADPPTRFIRVTARCYRPGVEAAVGANVESACGATGVLGSSESPADQQHRGELSRWFTSGHAEPLTEAAFRRLLVQQAVLRGRVALADRPAETARRRRAQRMILGLKLLSVNRDEHHISTGEIVRGRRMTIEVKPDQFPGGGCWPAVLTIARFLATSGPINEFTRLMIRTTPQGEEYTLPPIFGRRATL